MVHQIDVKLFTRLVVDQSALVVKKKASVSIDHWGIDRCKRKNKANGQKMESKHLFGYFKCLMGEPLFEMLDVALNAERSARKTEYREFVKRDNAQDTQTDFYLTEQLLCRFTLV
jgi:hypothetical protein